VLLPAVYQRVIRPALFKADPEFIHDRTLEALQFVRPLKSFLQPRFQVKDERLSQKIWGYRFDNPVGLAAGLDKNAVCADLWEMFGFSFVEVGTVTPRPQPGNPRPRLFRYPEQQAIVNRMGFNNDGADAIAGRLAQARPRTQSSVLGVSLGKQVDTPVNHLPQVIQDYQTSLEKFYDYGDFFVINVSSPNTKNLRDLQQGQNLRELFQALSAAIMELAGDSTPKPLCVKIAPDLSDDEIREAVDIALEFHIQGIIATNTTNQTGTLESGGLSGAPLRMRSTQVIQLIAEHTGRKVPLIGSGGIFTAADAIEKLQAGAWLLQVYTGFIYTGPSLVKEINQGICDYLDKNNIDRVSTLSRP
jgi:dihydroorotate dehydrogenase